MGAASCILVQENGRVEQTCWRFRNLKSELLDDQLGSLMSMRSRVKRTFRMAVWVRLSTRSVDVVSDALVCAGREALHAINGYDEAMLLYYTEDDVCLRLNRLGWGVWHFAGARALHHGQVTTRRRNPWSIAWLHRRDASNYFRKNITARSQLES